MPRPARWNELAIGLISLAVVAAVSIAVLVFARVGTLHGSTFPLYAVTDQARGVIRGSEVWLGGQKVGAVKEVHFLPPSYPPSGRLLVVMDVLSDARDKIRLNSTAQVRAGGTLIAAPVIYLSVGTSRARAVSPGDTLQALAQPDLETMTSRLAVASRELPAIIANVKLLAADMQSTKGTLGAFGIEHGGVALTRARAGASRLATAISSSRGSIGLAMAPQSALSVRARRAIARVDSIRTLVSSNRPSLGRFRRDSTLARAVADLRNEIDIVRARMASPEGTVGRLRSDSALVHALDGAQHEMTLMMADIRRHPLRYIHF